MLLEPRINFKGKTRGVPKKLLCFGMADNIGLLLQEIVPLPATGIQVNSLFRKGLVSGFQGQECVAMAAAFTFDAIAPRANDDIGQDSGGVIGVTKTPVIRKFSDLRVREISMHDSPQVSNLGAACRFRRHAIFGQ